MPELKFAVRQLWKSPGLTIAAVLTLALGVGANTAVFSFINAVLWRPLPYVSAGHLVRIASVNPGLGISDARTSDPNVVDWAERSSAFKELAAFQEWDGTLTISGRSAPVRVNWATPNLLSMLGVQPFLGRLLSASDVDTGVMLPYGIWEQHNRDADIIGRKVKLDGEMGTVVGILPPKTGAPTQGLRASDQVFIASDLRRTGWPRSLQLRNVVGELKPGISVARAQEDLSRVATVLEKEFPETNRGWGVRVTDLKRWETNLVHDQLWAIYAATAVIFLLACLNVSNLLLIRGEARRKELAIRAALGSTRWGLLRQLMSEGLILSFLGAALGLLLARWSQGVLAALTPASLGVEGSELGWPIFVSTLLAASLAALLSGLFPALWLSRGELHRGITENGRSNSAGPSRHRLLHGLVVGQIAISLALLFVAALAVVSFRALSKVDPGFAAAQAISFRVGTFANSASAERLIERLSLLPGVESVGASNIELLNDVFSNGIRITADNAHAPGGSISGTVDVWHATTNYFSAAGIPVRAGRVFETRDGYDVVIVNEALARRFFPGQNALGQSLRIPWTNSPGTPKRIVGIVGSVKQRGLRREDVPIYYLHYQGDQAGNLSLTVRTAVQPSALVPALRAAIRQADPELTLDRVFTAEEMVGRSTSGPRFATRLMMAFAALAILLAVLGLYGVMSYIVQQRTKEIGVRLALGAQRAEVFTLIIRRGMRLVGAGLVVGGVIAFLAGRAIQGALFEVSPADPRAFAAVVALLVITALAACCFPARRATQVDPITALKTE